MTKNIVLLSDGTGNSAAKFNKTNVWRTFEALDLTDPAKQVAIYDDGVGTQSFKPKALLGGAMGIGLAANVRELYAFLCRTYEPGDRIFGFGFSRGAFTIRTLIGFVTRFGILKHDPLSGDVALRRKVRLLYRLYRKIHSGGGADPAFAAMVAGVRDAMPWNRLPPEYFADGKPAEKYFHSPEIQFLGLWDTVDAYGFPTDEMREGWDKFVWRLSMRNRDLSAKVKRAVHALCLDDERNTFHPLLWNEEGNDEHSSTLDPVRQHGVAGHIDKERLSQVWFAGMHADVGGGYPEDFLSYVPLCFVLEQAVKGKDGLLLKPGALKALQATANASGTMHDSRRGMAAYYRLLPRKLSRLCDSKGWSFRWRDGLSMQRPEIANSNVVKISRPKIHHSVFDRMIASGSLYAPIVLPENYAVVDDKGKIIDAGDFGFEPKGGAAKRHEAQERVWDLVWWRRVCYFSTLFLTACLALLPWMTSLPFLGSLPILNRAVDGTKCIESIFCFLSFLPRLLDGFLPSFARTWIDSFVANPGIFGMLALAIVALMWTSTRLDSYIRHRMRLVWRPKDSLPEGRTVLTKFRESKPYRGFFVLLKHHVSPFVFGIFALFAILYGSFTVASRTVFAFLDAKGVYCKSYGPAVAVRNVYSRALSFDSRNPCWPSHLAVQKGEAYRIVMTTDDGWKDDTIPATVHGTTAAAPWYALLFAWPNKRYTLESYFKPVARITPGKKLDTFSAGQDEYVLDPVFPGGANVAQCLVSDFVAQSEGELFLYVNGPVLWFAPDLVAGTYSNNHGTAKVFVKRIMQPGEAFEMPPGAYQCEQFETGTFGGQAAY
jgi:hypothetical protein